MRSSTQRSHSLLPRPLAYLCPVMVPTLNCGARLKRESGSMPELSPQLYASHRGGPHTPLFALVFYRKASALNGKAAHPAEQARRPATAFTGSAFAEDGWRKRAAAALGQLIYQLFFGLGPAVVFFCSEEAAAGFESNFLHRKFDSDAFCLFYSAAWRCLRCCWPVPARPQPSAQRCPIRPG